MQANVSRGNVARSFSSNIGDSFASMKSEKNGPDNEMLQQQQQKRKSGMFLLGFYNWYPIFTNKNVVFWKYVQLATCFKNAVAAKDCENSWWNLLWLRRLTANDMCRLWSVVRGHRGLVYFWKTTWNHILFHHGVWGPNLPAGRADVTGCSYQSCEEGHSQMPQVIVQQAAVHHVPEDGDTSWLTQRVSCGDTNTTRYSRKQTPTHKRKWRKQRHRNTRESIIDCWFHRFIDGYSWTLQMKFLTSSF